MTALALRRSTKPKRKPVPIPPEPRPLPDGMPEVGPSHRLLWLSLAAISLGLHLAALTRYGWFRDELYYVVCARHLAWGYVDQPPLSVALLAGIRALAGESLVAIRIAAALATSAAVFLTARLAARLGGLRYAQMLAGVALLLAPVVLATGRFYSMNAFDLLLWTMAATALVGVIRQPGWARWLWLGVVMGLGLLNKISMLWFGLGLGVGLVVLPRGRQLIGLPCVAAFVLALAIFTPHLVWQAEHGWPTLEFMRNATGLKMVAVAPLQFLLEQFRVMGFANVLLYLPGLLFGLFSRTARPWRILGVLFLSVAALLIAAGSSRASYLTVAYPPLFALGGLAWERWTAGRDRWVREPFLALVALLGLPMIPFALPVLPVDLYLKYQSALGQRPSTEERKQVGPLPQGYADMFGWPELVAEVGKAAARLSPEERAHAVVFGQNYGEASAVNVLGQRLGLPPAVSGHNNYSLWGPGDWDGKAMIIIGGDPADNAQFFESVERVGVWSHPYAMPYERGLDISIGRGFRGSPAEVWTRLRHFS
jgi:hypothetical protein